MHERIVTVANPAGLHARPAARFVRAAAAQPAEVAIGRPGQDTVPAASILSVMTLGIGPGERVVLRADGDGAQEALDALATLLERDAES